MNTWIDIVGYEGQYKISNTGLVLSLSRDHKTGLNKKYITKDRILTPNKTKAGYYYVSLSRKKHLIHRLVAMAFIPNPTNKPHVNHINSVTTDNRIENLEWVSHRENLTHSMINRNIAASNTGVIWDKQKQKWRSQPYINGKRVYKLFESVNDASKHYWDTIESHNLQNKYGARSAQS